MQPPKMDWLKNNWFKLLAIGILLGAMETHPYSYYQLLRWVVCATAAYSAYRYLEADRTALVWVFGIMAILFNPLVPFYLDKDTWQLLDLVAAVIFAVSIFLKKKNPAHS